MDSAPISSLMSTEQIPHSTATDSRLFNSYTCMKFRKRPSAKLALSNSRMWGRCFWPKDSPTWSTKKGSVRVAIQFVRLPGAAESRVIKFFHRPKSFLLSRALGPDSLSLPLRNWAHPHTLTQPQSIARPLSL